MQDKGDIIKGKGNHQNNCIIPSPFVFPISFLLLLSSRALDS
jgi:hypothetical protein